MVRRRETETCIILQKWFLDHNITCWMNEGKNKFTTKLTQKKPDLIIYSPSLKQFIAIEVKNGDVASQVRDASKIIEYKDTYDNKEIKYFIREEEIKISSFAVATLYSMEGRLFEDDILRTQLEDSKDKWKCLNKKYGLEPYHEYQRTHDYVRSLWKEWAKKRKREYAAGLGIILCQSLNRENFYNIKGSSPILFDQQWEYKKYRKQFEWKVKQKRL